MRPDWIHPEDVEYNRLRKTIDALRRIILRIFVNEGLDEQSGEILLDSQLSMEMNDED